MQRKDFFLLPPGMELFMNTFQTVLIDMGVYLGSGDIRVAKHHLYGPQVGTVTEKMGGERVPEHVGRDILVDPGGQGCFSHDLPESEPCHAAAAAGNKEIIASLALEDAWSCCL